MHSRTVHPLYREGIALPLGRTAFSTLARLRDVGPGWHNDRPELAPARRRPVLRIRKAPCTSSNEVGKTQTVLARHARMNTKNPQCVPGRPASATLHGQLTEYMKRPEPVLGFRADARDHQRFGPHLHPQS